MTEGETLSSSNKAESNAEGQEIRHSDPSNGISTLQLLEHNEHISNQVGNDHSFCEFPFPPDFIFAEKQREEEGSKKVETVKEKQVENKHLIFDHLAKHGGKRLDILEMCKRYEISLNGTDDFGKPYQKSEEELKEDIEFHLELEQYSAWHATTQASTPLSTTEARLILAAKGISTSTESIVLTNSDLMPIQMGWGRSLCGMFAGRFPGKEAVYTMVKRGQVPVKVAFHKKGWIIFSFKKAVDLETVREKGPHSIFGIPLVLEPTPEDFDLKGKMKVNVAIWI